MPPRFSFVPAPRRLRFPASSVMPRLASAKLTHSPKPALNSGEVKGGYRARPLKPHKAQNLYQPESLYPRSVKDKRPPFGTQSIRDLSPEPRIFDCQESVLSLAHATAVAARRALKPSHQLGVLSALIKLRHPQPRHVVSHRSQTLVQLARNLVLTHPALQHR